MMAENPPEWPAGSWKQFVNRNTHSLRKKQNPRRGTNRRGPARGEANYSPKRPATLRLTPVSDASLSRRS
jgi:hypothetical protein